MCIRDRLGDDPFHDGHGQGEVAQVHDLVAGGDHAVPVLDQGRVVLLDGGEGAPRAQGQDIAVGPVTVGRPPAVRAHHVPMCGPARQAAPAAHLTPVTTPTTGRGIPAGPVRAHLVAKVAEGATLVWLAEQSGASEKTIQNVLHGKRPTVYAKTAERLLAVDGTPPVPKRRVDPAQTVHEVTELHGAGWALVDIAKVAGLSRVTVLESNLATGVTAETEARVHHAWRVLHRRPGPAPRTYPWLADLLASYPVGEVAAGAAAALRRRA